MATARGSKDEKSTLKVDAKRFVPYMRTLRDQIPELAHRTKHSPTSDVTQSLRESFTDGIQRLGDCPLSIRGKDVSFLEGFQQLVEAGSRGKDPFDVPSAEFIDIWSLPGFKEAGNIQVGSSEWRLRDVLPVFRFEASQFISVNEPSASGEDDPCYLHGSNNWWTWLVGAHYEARSWTTCDGNPANYPSLKVEAYIWGTCGGMWFGPEKQKTVYNTSSVKVSWNTWGTVAAQCFSKHVVCVSSTYSGCVTVKVC
jgi:hypothetical protein